MSVCLPGERGAARGDPPCRRRQARQAVHAPLRDASRRGSLRRPRRGSTSASWSSGASPRRACTRTRPCSVRACATEEKPRRWPTSTAGSSGGSTPSGLPVNVALKLTHLGLELDEERRVRERRASRPGRRIGSRASCGSTWSSRASSTRPSASTAGCARRGHDRVGTVLQSYLYRSQADLESLLPLQPNLRFVKGAYLEPPEIAYAAKPEVDAAFARLVETALRGWGVRGGRDPRRTPRRPLHRLRGTRGHPAGPFRAADAVRRATRAPARARPARSCSLAWRRPTARSGTRT